MSTEDLLNHFVRLISSKRVIAALAVSGASIIGLEYAAEMKWITYGPSYYLGICRGSLKNCFMYTGTKFGTLSTFLAKIDIEKIRQLVTKYIEPLFKSFYNLGKSLGKILLTPYYMLPSYKEVARTFEQKRWLVYAGSMLLCSLPFLIFFKWNCISGYATHLGSKANWFVFNKI